MSVRGHVYADFYQKRQIVVVDCLLHGIPKRLGSLPVEIRGSQELTLSWIRLLYPEYKMGRFRFYTGLGGMARTCTHIQ